MNKCYVFFLVLTILFSCEHGKNDDRLKKNKKTAAPSKNSFADKKKLITNGDAAEIDKEDSLILKNMLTDMLALASKHISDKNYKKTLSVWDYTSNTANISYGHLFSLNQKHLVITRIVRSSLTHVDVFLLKRSAFSPVATWFLDDDAYLKYSIKDINGDNHKDFLVNLYSSSGCCRRNVYDVYLYKPGDGTFTQRYEFINPTFSPAEKVIRGISYGQPGDVGLYKYRWMGLKVDTDEIIFPDRSGKKYHVVKRWADIDNNKTGRFITNVPSEYYKIESYAWFKGEY